jgi:hypothetical protein
MVTKIIDELVTPVTTASVHSVRKNNLLIRNKRQAAETRKDRRRRRRRRFVTGY